MPIDRSKYSELWVTANDGQAMCALINGDRGWLMYLREEGDAGFSSRNPTFTGPADAKLEFFLNNGQRDEYPLAWTLPVEEVQRALDYFKDKKKPPPFVSWHNDSNDGSIIGPGGATESALGTISFYSTADEYGEFSNFASFPITLKGKRWPTSEHYFQAQKFEDASHREAIRKANSPTIAARMGRDRKKKLRRDWESVKVGIMREAVLAKFTQHDDLRTLLLSTGGAKIIEHTERDSYWGDGGDGSGRNMLGRILMQVREELHKQADELKSQE
jgi:ribA/ribD-fused uncharacterized protein